MIDHILRNPFSKPLLEIALLWSFTIFFSWGIEHLAPRIKLVTTASDISPILGGLSSSIDYPSDDFVFSSHGYDLHIDNELVAAAFAELPQQAQSILILHCVLEMADGEIGALMGMSRSAVQRHRTKTLKELRTKLMALMPEGG